MLFMLKLKSSGKPTPLSLTVRVIRPSFPLTISMITFPRCPSGNPYLRLLVTSSVTIRPQGIAVSMGKNISSAFTVKLVLHAMQ